MATVKYFSDYRGETHELASIWPMRNEQFAAMFPGVKGVRYDGYFMTVGGLPGRTLDSQALPVTRKITRKSFPSLHVCNAKCMGGKHNGACECQCGGKNHGRGLFTSKLAA